MMASKRRLSKQGRSGHAVAARRNVYRELQLRCGLPCGASAFAAPADYDRCNAVLAWHIDSGHVDETDVSDRSVVLVLDAPKQMSEGNWRIGMFMDDRASAEQMKHYGREIDRLGGRRGPGSRSRPLAAASGPQMYQVPRQRLGLFDGRPGPGR